MTEKQAKQPAHEVILRKVKEHVDGLINTEQCSPSYFSTLTAVSVLLDVLREMAIPQKARKKILDGLQQVASQWDTFIGDMNIPQLPYDKLSKD